MADPAASLPGGMFYIGMQAATRHSCSTPILLAMVPQRAAMPTIESIVGYFLTSCFAIQSKHRTWTAAGMLFLQPSC